MSDKSMKGTVLILVIRNTMQTYKLFHNEFETITQTD